MFVRQCIIDFYWFIFRLINHLIRSPAELVIPVFLGSKWESFSLTSNCRKTSLVKNKQKCKIRKNHHQSLELDQFRFAYEGLY